MQELDQKILRIIDLLIFLKKTKNEASFAESININRQTITNIKNGSQHFTASHIYKICKLYSINANCILGTEKNVFKNNARIVLTGVFE